MAYPEKAIELLPTRHRLFEEITFWVHDFKNSRSQANHRQNGEKNQFNLYSRGASYGERLIWQISRHHQHLDYTRPTAQLGEST